MSITKYLKLIYTALEKLPFFNYINRLAAYIKNPELNDAGPSNKQLEHSLLDIFNALGLVIVISIGFTLYSSDFGYMNAYKIFNPLFVSFSYVTYGLLFALGMVFFSWLLSKTSLFSKSSGIDFLFYTVFCHSLRFYAATGLFVGTLAVHATGLAITKGMDFNTAFEYPGLMLAIVITLFWFPFRLYVNPLFRYLNPLKLKVVGYASILLAIFLVTSANQVLQMPFTDRMMVSSEMCKLIKSGSFYKNSDARQKPEMEKKFCKLKEE